MPAVAAPLPRARDDSQAERAAILLDGVVAANQATYDVLHAELEAVRPLFPKWVDYDDTARRTQALLIFEGRCPGAFPGGGDPGWEAARARYGLAVEVAKEVAVYEAIDTMFQDSLFHRVRLALKDMLAHQCIVEFSADGRFDQVRLQDELRALPGTADDSRASWRAYAQGCSKHVRATRAPAGTLYEFVHCPDWGIVETDASFRVLGNGTVERVDAPSTRRAGSSNPVPAPLMSTTKSPARAPPAATAGDAFGR